MYLDRRLSPIIQSHEWKLRKSETFTHFFRDKHNDTLGPTLFYFIRPSWFFKVSEAIENLVFYCVYCKDQRNAAVIIIRYTMLLHNGIWEVVYIFTIDTMWRKPCILSSKSGGLNVALTFQLWCCPCIFRISM